MKVMGISREWRAGMRECATIGFDYEPPNPLAPWVVTTGRTASGEAMERTNEEMIEDSVRHFDNDTAAARWCKENGYR